MEELKRFQGSTFDGFLRRQFVELTAKIQELQNEVNCMNDSIDSKMLNQYAVDNPHVPSQPTFFTPFSRSWRNAKPFSGNAESQR